MLTGGHLWDAVIPQGIDRGPGNICDHSQKPLIHKFENQCMYSYMQLVYVNPEYINICVFTRHGNKYHI